MSWWNDHQYAKKGPMDWFQRAQSSAAALWKLSCYL
jgi:hypothetical protein